MKFGLTYSVKAILNAEKISDYFELSAASIAELSEEDFNGLLAALTTEKISCYAVNGLFPSEMRLTGPEVDFDKIESYLNNLFQRLAKLGVSIAVFGSGKAKQVPEGFAKEAAWMQLIRLGELLSAAAVPYGITVVIEPLRYQEVNIINTVVEAASLVKDIKKSNVKLLADFYHMAQNGEDFSVLSQYADLLSHVHIAEPVNRGMLNGECADFIKKCFEALKNAGYDQAVSFEGKHASDYAGATEMLALFQELWQNN